MKRDILVSSLLGTVALFICLFVFNALLPFKSNLIHQRLPFEQQVEIHEVLKENITEQGTYSVPYLSPREEENFPDYRAQPVYSIQYDGMTHGVGSPPSFLPLLLILLTALLATWLLSLTTERFRSRYLNRALFVASIGVVMVLFDDLLQMGFGPQPRDYLIFLAVSNLITWVVAGLVIAWKMKPRSG